MTAVRENILVSTTVRDEFITGMRTLDETPSGLRASDLFAFLQRNGIGLPMRGIDQDLSVYDIFVFWHVLSMAIRLPVGNAAHGGPIFLPWHRMYLLRLEQTLQNVLGNPDFGLPYWDWAEDGELPASQQWRTDLWTADYLGEARGAVRSGGFGAMRVRLAQDPFDGALVSVAPRPIERASGMTPGAITLPDKTDEAWALAETAYDLPDWSRAVQGGHRNVLEGWVNGPQLHNRVHVWVGGDMSPGTSPNDPVFFLNHCNVDRLWQMWMDRNGPVYEPRAGQGPQGHRIDSVMVSIIGQALTPGDVLDTAQWYSYDTALVA